EIVSQVNDLGVKHVIFSGGEPLLRHDLPQIIEFAIKSGIKMVDIITNGILLDEAIIKKLIGLRLNHITVSLDGLKETNNQIRGKGSFEKSASNIDILNFYKKKLNSSFPTLGINFTIMDKNILDIPAIIEFARSKQCNVIVFQPVLFSNTRMHENKQNDLWPREDNIRKLEKLIEDLILLKNSSGDIFIYTDTSILRSLPRYFRGRSIGGDFKCYEAIKRIVITYEGQVWSCMGVYGDLRKDLLRDIWTSKNAAAVRSKVKKCSRHCLQDCVFFPSDISSIVQNLLNSGESTARGDAFKIIDDYVHILSSHKERNPLKIFERANFNSQLKKIISIRDLLSRPA
ncbi:MAG: radical SAM protein, partial [Candidatus Omnitrophica bacterium]|nr:radical SAM protein [Candidatus Omnitrophota bacterium]